MYILSFDIGGTAIKYGMIDDEEQILDKGSKLTPYNNELFLNTISEIVEEFENKYTFEVITFSFPGYINTATGFAENSGSLQFFKGTNILDQIALKIDSHYQLYIENDANCAALAEKYSGKAVNTNNFLLVTIGTGFGGAFFLNNELIRGFKFKAGEFGHMRIDTSKNMDLTVNEMVSVRTLIADYKKIKQLSDETNISGEEILDQYHSDSEAQELIIKWIDNISVSIFNVITVINPEKVLVGGGISQHPLLIELIRDRMSAQLEDWHEFEIPIETCKYQNDAGLMGAFYSARKNIKADVSVTH